ncbi:MAG: 50S ribosomal protein L24 [Candidatus Njordarchaeota archaeon]
MKLNPKISSQPRKIRRAMYRLPHHRRLKMMVAPLTKEAREKYGIKRISVRKGDTVIIRKGRFKGIIGKIVEVIPKKFKIHVEGATMKRAGGSIVYYPIYVWNVAIVDLDLSDPKRKEAIERKKTIKKEEISKSMEEGGAE